jgi:hypothetical protein
MQGAQFWPELFSYISISCTCEIVVRELVVRDNGVLLEVFAKNK